MTMQITVSWWMDTVQHVSSQESWDVHHRTDTCHARCPDSEPGTDDVSHEIETLVVGIVSVHQQHQLEGGVKVMVSVDLLSAMSV